MARRKHREGESLQKVLGVPALFSTAYGNVGSSIYYALGVVALWALGVTPVVFLLTGLLFVHHRLVLRRGDGHGARGRRLVELRAAAPSTSSSASAPAGR